MANPTGKDVTFQVDNAGASITDISTHINSASVQATLNILEDSALGDTDRTQVAGLHGKTFPISGFWNSTTEAIYGPHLAARTSVTKTVEYGDGNRYYNGEALTGNVQVTGPVDALQTFSADHTISGALNRTSVKLT